MPVTITPRKRPVEPVKPAEPAKPLDAKTQAIEAQRAKDAIASAEARKRALTPKPIAVTPPPKPNEWEQQPATAATKRESGRHAAIVAPDAAVAVPAKNIEPKYGEASRAPSPAIAATSGAAKPAPRDASDVDADDLDGRPTVRVVPGAAAATAKADATNDADGPTTVRRDSAKPGDLAASGAEPDVPTVRRAPAKPDGPTVRHVPATAEAEPDGPTVRRVAPTAATEPEGPTAVRRDSVKPADVAAADGAARREPAKPGTGDLAASGPEPDSPAVRRDSSKPVATTEPPLAHINGAAIHEASDLDAAETVDGMKAVGNSTEALEKIDQEDLIDAPEDASPAEIRSVLMKDVAPAVKRARPITEPPPPPAKRTPTAPPTKRAPTTPPPPRASVDELPRGNFAYPVKKRRSGLALKLLLAAVILGAGFFAVVLIFRDDESAATKPPEPTPTPVATTPTPPPEPVPVVAPDAAVEEPDIEMDPTPPPPPKPTPKTGTDPKPKTPKTPATPKTGSSTPATNPATPADAAVAVVDDDCDETSCVLTKYERACCAKYKPATTDFKPRVGEVPESLDKTMVRAGVERVKPRVVACGEKSTVKGTVKIALAVSPDGAVTSASVADSPDPALGECVLNAMKSAKFGKTVNGSSFTYPFAF
jgi:TonB family protein